VLFAVSCVETGRREGVTGCCTRPNHSPRNCWRIGNLVTALRM